LKGNSAPVRLRVPSGNVRNAFPSLSDAAADGDEAADLKGLAEERQLRQLAFEEHVQPRMQRLKQNRRIDVAFMVAAEHHGLAGTQVLAAGDPDANARERGSQSNAPMSEHVQHTFPAERQRQGHTDRRSERNVERDGEVRSQRSNGSDEGRHQKGGNRTGEPVTF
jgi:hypothetical protein